MWNLFHRCWLFLLWFSLSINCPKLIKTWVFWSCRSKVDQADYILWAGKFWPNKPGWGSFGAVSTIFKWFYYKTYFIEWTCCFIIFHCTVWTSEGLHQAFWFHLRYLASSGQFISGQPLQWYLWPSSLYPIVLCIEVICTIHALTFLLPQSSSSLPIFLFTACSLFWEPCFQFLHGMWLLGL